MDNSKLWERASILNAYLVPRSVSTQLYPTVSPVNSFRLLFDGLFDAGLERLPDRTYYASWSTPYMFTEVTKDRLEPIPPIAGATH